MLGVKVRSVFTPDFAYSDSGRGMALGLMGRRRCERRGFWFDTTALAIARTLLTCSGPVHQCCYPLARARGAPPPDRAAGDAATAAPGELRGRTALLPPRSRSARGVSGVLSLSVSVDVVARQRHAAPTTKVWSCRRFWELRCAGGDGAGGWTSGWRGEGPPRYGVDS